MPADVVVSSWSLAGFAQYGARCAAAWARYWPASTSFVVYTDGRCGLRGIEERSTEAIAEWTAIKEDWHCDPSVRGYRCEAYPDRTKFHEYVWDARRFAVKVFVWADAAARYSGTGVMTWLDGDTETMQPVPAGLTRDLLGDADVAYLGRGAMHPETGYVGFRLPEAWPLIAWCRDAYVSGQFRDLRDGWTDSHVLRAGLQAVSVRARDLTSERYAGEWRSGIDAMGLSPLGLYVTHYKGTQAKRALVYA